MQNVNISTRTLEAFALWHIQSTVRFQVATFFSLRRQMEDRPGIGVSIFAMMILSSLSAKTLNLLAIQFSGNGAHILESTLFPWMKAKLGSAESAQD